MRILKKIKRLMRFVSKRLRGEETLSLKEKIETDYFESGKGPQYAYGIYHAALQAKALNLPGMTVIEFGVASGNGLLMMERIAEAVESELEIKIRLAGFDNATGLSKPNDYRDMPYEWKEGFFRMDVKALKDKLRKSELIIGEVGHNISGFLEALNKKYPIGFVSLDLDYYSSTKSALKLFDSDNLSFYLPRVICTFDSLSSDTRYLCEHVGEPAARAEFNEKWSDRKICKIEHLGYRRKRKRLWNEKVFACHFFQHPLYCEYIHPSPDRQIKLRQ